jgi:hypothetical protein
VHAELETVHNRDWLRSTNDYAGDNILPSIGGGIRFMAVVEERVNVGLDVAVGREGPALHIMLMEAF